MGLLLAVGLCVAPRPAAAELEVVFIDPDANLANLARLRAKMSAFLRTIDKEASFKTFAKLADLKRYLETHQVQFVLAAGDLAARLDLELRPIATPLRNGSATYRKVLVTRKGTDPSAIQVVATTSSPDEVTALPVPGRAADAPRLRVLRVSKGFDALLGMLFNRADAAYVTPETVAELERVDPKLAANLDEIYRSPPIPNPQLHVVKNKVSPATAREVAAAFQEMHRTPVGRAVLHILDYTGWSSP